MTSESFNSGQVPEAPILAPRHFGQSIGRLYGLVDAMGDDPQNPVYYDAEWDADEPTRIADVKLMTAVPTGALADQRRGKFYRAQFKTAELSKASGERQERLIWCATAGQRPGRHLPPDNEALRAEFGYTELNSENASRTLHQKAETGDDYFRLLNSMAQRRIEVFPEFKQDLNSMMYGYINDLRDQPDALLETGISSGELASLIRSFRDVNPTTSTQVQGLLVSKLLRSIAVGWTSVIATQEPHEKQDASATILETAIASGTIDNEPRIIHRIFNSRAIFRYPFATDLLHAELARDPQLRLRKKIFSTDRAAFVHNYVLMVLDGRSRSGSKQDENINQKVKDFLLTQWPTDRTDESVPLANIMQLADNLTRYATGDAPKIPTKALPQSGVLEVYAVAPAFRKILGYLDSADPESTRSQHAFNDKAVHIVETILAPVGMTRMEKQARVAAFILAHGRKDTV